MNGRERSPMRRRHTYGGRRQLRKTHSSTSPSRISLGSRSTGYLAHGRATCIRTILQAARINFMFARKNSANTRTNFGCDATTANIVGL